MTLQTCPCRKTASAPISYAECCQPVVEGKTQAQSAEALMRARYSAFAVGKIDYLIEREAHHERSTFRFDETAKRWYFVDGGKPRGKTVVKGAQPGRNDPCTCGSGKKYKKCCGTAA